MLLWRPWRWCWVIYIQGSKRVSVQLDCSRSTNAVVSRESSVHVLEVMPNSIIVSLHNWETVVHNYVVQYLTERGEDTAITQIRPIAYRQTSHQYHSLCILVNTSLHKLKVKMERPGEVLIYLFTVVLPYYTLPPREVGGWFTHCILWLYSQAPLHGLGVGI